MSKLRKILKEQQSYVKNSGFTVDVDYSLPSVTIANNEDEIFLDGDSAEQYITEATRVWEEAGDVGMNVVLYAVAKQYVDSI